MIEMRKIKGCLILIVAANCVGVFASVTQRKKIQELQAQQILATSPVREKLKHLDNVYKYQELALKEIDKSFDQQVRIKAKIVIGEYVTNEVIQTIDISIVSERLLHKECQNFIKDKKSKAEYVQSMCLQCFSCCPEREVQELPADYYVEAAQQILTDRSFKLHPLRESQIIFSQDRS